MKKIQLLDKYPFYVNDLAKSDTDAWRSLIGMDR